MCPGLQRDHYDAVIQGYRECAIEKWENPAAQEVVRRMSLTAWKATDGAWRRGRSIYPHAQLIDLEATGYISAHRDNMKLFGEFTAGLNLLSSAVIRFRPMTPNSSDSSELAPVLDVVLRPRTLYVMHDVLRWEYTHEVLDSDDMATNEVWKDHGREHAGDVRGRRLSVIVRDMGAPGFFGSFF